MVEPQFAGYRVVDTLGSGALATIYKAEQESLGRTVAIKALKSSIAPSSSFAGQLDREAKVLGELFHANVVLLVDYRAATGDAPSFLVLEYVDGPSLAELVARRRVLRPEAAAAIGYQVAEGLAHTHERGVVHRDIKPQNVLLSRRGDVKLIDFGIAERERLPSVAEPLPTRGGPERTHAAFGTPAYMSPEQILGDTVDARSDLFSLGVILYRMLTGTRPFEGEASGGAPRVGGQRLRRDAPAPFRERAPDVPRPLERVVMKLLQKNPSDRFASAREVADELSAFLRSFSGASPQRLVVAALVEAGYVKDDVGRRAGVSDASTRRTRRQVISARTSALGFAAIGAGFALLAGLSEVVASDSRTVRAAGSRPLELAPAQGGSLRVLATPWAEVSVDGQHVDTTPFARPIPLPPGPHFVTLTHPNARPENRQVMIRAGEVVTVDVALDLGEAQDAGGDA
ncbi:MAG TPA: serine/threonine-protein kinase, partial [Polyangiaceae bacterium]|nr:serine/threonine-protein kinase [Polyangiaceae bacterium]